MNIYFHIIIGILATGFFAWQYKHTKFVYQLLLAIWTPLTFLTYISPNKNFQVILGIVQLALFFLVLFFLFRARKIQAERNRVRAQQRLEMEEQQAKEDALQEAQEIGSDEKDEDII